MDIDGIQLGLFSARVSAICDEMGAVLRQAAFSPNIKDRLDFSCALFDGQGRLFAQAAHIPVHLGSMAYAMEALVDSQDWLPGDLLAVNDPFLGGTHLPDVTLISPVYVPQQAQPVAFVANRAHHADIGCDTPGSMPLSRTLEEEGLIIPPTLLRRDDKLLPMAGRLPGSSAGGLGGDFAAQAGSVDVGVRQLTAQLNELGLPGFEQSVASLNHYADRLMAATLDQLAAGEYEFVDYLDDDGYGNTDLPIRLRMTVGQADALGMPDLTGQSVLLDFSGSSAQVPGNLNCPESVVAAAVYYCFRCLLPESAPSCFGLFQRIRFLTEENSLLNASRPAAVAAGNVETSTRLVDVTLGALAGALPTVVPAASQGSMNNIAMGRIDGPDSRWDYYETLAGGSGAGPQGGGADGVHSHMTNTLNTPVESVEMHFPLRITRYELRRDSGGHGLHRGGNGVVREYEFLEDAELSLLTERRRLPPWGLEQGKPGAPGRNELNGKAVAGKLQVSVQAGDRLTVWTPGGGGWGAEPTNRPDGA